MAADTSEPARWLNRLHSYRNSLRLVKLAADLWQNRSLNELERAGFVQSYEIAWDLAWKLMADFLRFAGRTLDFNAPKPVIRAAFEAQIIADGQRWIDATDLRNQLSHIYDEERALRALDQIATVFLPLMVSLEERLSDEAAKLGHAY